MGGDGAAVLCDSRSDIGVMAVPCQAVLEREPFCVVRTGQPCEFTVGPTERCWYCLLTREQIAVGLTLGDVLGVKRMEEMESECRK